MFISNTSLENITFYLEKQKVVTLIKLQILKCVQNTKILEPELGGVHCRMVMQLFFIYYFGQDQCISSRQLLY